MQTVPRRTRNVCVCVAMGWGRQAEGRRCLVAGARFRACGGAYIGSMDAPLSVGGSVVRSIQNVHSNKGRDASIVWGAAPSPLLCSEKEGAARRVRRSLGRLSCKEVGAKANVASVTLPRNTHPNSAAVGVDLRLVQGRASEIVQQGFGCVRECVCACDKRSASMCVSH